MYITSLTSLALVAVQTDNVNFDIAAGQSLEPFVQAQVGDGTGNFGQASLTGSGTLATVNEWVGIGGGAGTFSQSGGTDDASSLVLGRNGGADTYILSAGTLSAAENIGGNSGVGTFIQSGGTNVAPGLLIDPGSYSLSGSGSLTVNNGGSVSVGDQNGDASTFAVSGGSMAVAGEISVYSSATFSLSGGTVSAGSITISSGGTFNANSGTLNAPVFASGNLIANGAANPIQINGTLTLASTTTTLVQCSGSVPSFGKITSTGNVALAGALELYEDAANEASTKFGQSFIILQTPAARSAAPSPTSPAASASSPPTVRRASS